MIGLKRFCFVQFIIFPYFENETGEDNISEKTFFFRLNDITSKFYIACNFMLYNYHYIISLHKI